MQAVVTQSAHDTNQHVSSAPCTHGVHGSKHRDSGNDSALLAALMGDPVSQSCVQGVHGSSVSKHRDSGTDSALLAALMGDPSQAFDALYGGRGRDSPATAAADGSGVQHLRTGTADGNSVHMSRGTAEVRGVSGAADVNGVPLSRGGSEELVRALLEGTQRHAHEVVESMSEGMEWGGASITEQQQLYQQLQQQHAQLQREQQELQAQQAQEEEQLQREQFERREREQQQQGQFQQQQQDVCGMQGVSMYGTLSPRAVQVSVL